MNEYPSQGQDWQSQGPSSPGWPAQGQQMSYQQAYPQQGWPQQPNTQYPPQQPFYPPQQPLMPPVPPKKKSRVGLIVGIVIAIGVLLACGGIFSAMSSAAKNASTVASSTTSKVIPTQAAPTQASQQTYKVGDLVKVGDAWTVKIDSATVSNGDGTYTPSKPGYRYLILNLSMQNLTNANHTISSIIQFTLRGTDGTKYTIGLYPTAGSQIDGDVNGGQPAKGVIVYEVPANVNAFTLDFKANPFDVTSGQATWVINV